jgi:hypothetical protein
MKNGVFRDVTPCDSLRTDVLEEFSASIIRVTRIGELGTKLAVTNNRRTHYIASSISHAIEVVYQFRGIA